MCSCFFSRGFVTFDKVEAAERAISDMDGSIVGGIQLKVSLARRQPQIEPINDATSSSTWSTLGKKYFLYCSFSKFEYCFVSAASHSQKGNHRDKRDLVTYDDMFD